MYCVIYPGKLVYCCQNTTQYPVKIKRKIRNRGGHKMVTKFLATCAKLGGGASPPLRGSRKKNSTKKNIANTLSAETRNTFSNAICLCTQDATYGPEALPMFTIV